MPEITFIFETIENKIQCEANDLLKDLCAKFANKIGIDIKNLYFLYYGDKLDLNLRFGQISQDNDVIKILVYDHQMFQTNQIQQQMMQNQIAQQLMQQSMQQQFLQQQKILQASIQKQISNNQSIISSKNNGINLIFRIISDSTGQNSAPIIIQCMPNDKISTAIEKYRNKSGDTDSTKKFEFNAKSLDPLLTIIEAGLNDNSQILVLTTKNVQGA